MTERGVIAVDRGVFTHPRFAGEAFTEREAWIWLISEAAFKPHARRVGPLMLNLRRGQVAHSLRFMAERWQWSVGKVRRFVKMLATSYGEDDALITAVVDTGITVISICKYNSYQHWLRRVDTPHVTLTGTPMDTPIDTANGTPQETLNLYPTTPISDENLETGTPVDTPTDTRTDTGAAHLQHKRESIASSSSSSSSSKGEPSSEIAMVTKWDEAFARKFLKAIKIDNDKAQEALEAVTYYAVVWRTRGYDMDWALALGAEIALDHKKTKPPLSYFNKAIGARQDARAREVAREARAAAKAASAPEAAPSTKPSSNGSNGHRHGRNSLMAVIKQERAKYVEREEELSKDSAGVHAPSVQLIPPRSVR